MLNVNNRYGRRHGDGSKSAHARLHEHLGGAEEGTPAYLKQWYPDIIYPAPEKGISVPAAGVQPFLLEISIPQDAEPGLYTLTLRVRSAESMTEQPMALRIYDFEIPERFSLGTASGFRGPNARIILQYGLDPAHFYGK